jgi:hypothetical protein
MLRAIVSPGGFSSVALYTETKNVIARTRAERSERMLLCGASGNERRRSVGDEAISAKMGDCFSKITTTCLSKEIYGIIQARNRGIAQFERSSPEVPSVVALGATSLRLKS